MAVMQAPAARSLSDRAWDIYYRMRPQIETADNIGMLIMIDVDSGNFEIADDDLGFAASALLRERHPSAKLFALRIGYNVSASFSGSMELLPE